MDGPPPSNGVRRAPPAIARGLQRLWLPAGASRPAVLRCTALVCLAAALVTYLALSRVVCGYTELDADAIATTVVTPATGARVVVPGSSGERGSGGGERGSGGGVRGDVTRGAGGALSRRRVYDCTWMNAELDLLLARMEELDNVADGFVVVESPKNFAGRPKPLHLKDNMHRFARFADRITRVEVDTSLGWAELPPFGKQALQRSHIVNGLQAAGARPTDLAVFSDVDELPSARALAYIRDHVPGAELPVALNMKTYAYDFGCTIDSTPVWVRAKVARVEQLKFECTSDLSATAVCPDAFRDRYYWRWVTSGFTRQPLVVDRGGWHITNFLPPEGIVTKLKSAAHQERGAGNHTSPANIRCLILNCVGLYNTDRGQRHAIHPDELPQAMRSDPTFQRYLHQPAPVAPGEAAEQARLRAIDCGAPKPPAMLVSSHTRRCSTPKASAVAVVVAALAVVLVLAVASLGAGQSLCWFHRRLFGDSFTRRAQRHRL